MTTLEVVWFCLALLLMTVGLAGSVLPALPGMPLIFVVAVLHRLLVGASGAQTWVLVTLGVLGLLALAADYAAGVLGAKALGATRWGMLGAVLGGLVGLFFVPVGVILGPFLGAFALEFIAGQELRESAKAGAGAALGLLVGAVGKLACGVAMILLFAVNVLWRAYGTPG